MPKIMTGSMQHHGLMEEIKVLAIRQRCTMKELIEEALIDLLIKYKKDYENNEKIFRQNLSVIKRKIEERAISRFKKRMNPILLFVGEECIVDEGASVLPPKLYNAYKRWSNDENLFCFGKTRFYEQINKHFSVRRERVETKEYFVGIGLLCNSESENSL